MASTSDCNVLTVKRKRKASRLRPLERSGSTQQLIRTDGVTSGCRAPGHRVVSYGRFPSDRAQHLYPACV